jgi:hypothetical protein
MKEVYYAGLDVHKDTVQIAILRSRGKKPVSSKCVPNKVFHGGDEAVKTDYRDAVDIARMLRRDEGELGEESPCLENRTTE